MYYVTITYMYMTDITIRLHMSLNGHQSSVWDDASMAAFWIVLSEKWEGILHSSLDFHVEPRFRRNCLTSTEPVLYGPIRLKNYIQQRRDAHTAMSSY